MINLISLRDWLSSLSDWDQFWLMLLVLVISHALIRPWAKLGDALGALADKLRAESKAIEAQTQAAAESKSPWGKRP